MFRKYTYLLCFFLIGVLCHGQEVNTFSGKVMDEKAKPLAGAIITIEDPRATQVTDQNGEFTFGEIQANKINAYISYWGYDTLVQKVNIESSSNFNFYLEKAVTKLDEVVISDNYAEQRKKESSLTVEIVNQDFIKQNLGGSLMNSLERLPGVTTIDIGAGQAKPVIRGLSFNRVLVVENNIKHEAQQWGSDHGLEIDQYNVENVEIIMGPASLMYGSDAIGGVIDMNNRSVPEKNSFGITVDLTGKTNNNMVGTSLSIFTRKNDWYVTARATLVNYGDYRVPTDSVAIYSYHVPLQDNFLRNTAGYERNLHSSFGILKKRFQSKFFISNVNSSSGFFANAHGLEPRNVDHEVHDNSNRDILYPFQKVNHFKAINRNTLRGSDWKIELDLGYQNNNREEWSVYTQHGYMPPSPSENLDFNPEMERKFNKNIFSANSTLFYAISEQTKITAGLNSEYKINDISGRGFIIPAFAQFTAGGFGIAKHRFSDKSLLQAGLRYDYGTINTESYQDWFVSPIDKGGRVIYENLNRAEDISRNFSNVSWSIGYNYLPENWTYKFNVGKSFRMPIAKELAANGVNYHRFSFEVGNANLSPEISYQADARIEYSTKKSAIGASPFINYFTNYIYLNPTARFNRLYGFGNQVFEYTQSEVLRYGGEVHAHFDPVKNLQIGVLGEYVYALQMSGPKKGFTLPFAPPASAIFNIKYRKPKVGHLENTYISVDYRITATQNNIVPPEVVTDGFQVVNLALGGDAKVSNREIMITLQVQNLFNTRYFNHTSFYRLINVPEPGRNIIINLTIPFTKKLNE